jgi:hypothetical protein
MIASGTESGEYRRVPPLGVSAMTPKMAAIATMLLVSAAATAGSPALAQPAQPNIPQSIALSHQENVAELTMLSGKPAPVGPAAQAALEVLKAHIVRENTYIMPPLTLLAKLADGKITPDMKWAIAMADRVKADREEIFQEHTRITDAMNALLLAADQANDTSAAEFAHGAVADSLSDIELQLPMTLVIGDLLRSKLEAKP